MHKYLKYINRFFFFKHTPLSVLHWPFTLCASASLNTTCMERSRGPEWKSSSDSSHRRATNRLLPQRFYSLSSCHTFTWLFKQCWLYPIRAQTIFSALAEVQPHQINSSGPIKWNLSLFHFPLWKSIAALWKTFLFMRFQPLMLQHSDGWLTDAMIRCARD